MLYRNGMASTVPFFCFIHDNRKLVEHASDCLGQKLTLSPGFLSRPFVKRLAMDRKMLYIKRQTFGSAVEYSSLKKELGGFGRKYMFCANILIYLNLCFWCIRKGKSIFPLKFYLESNALWMFLLFLITEAYSLFHGLNTFSLWITWGMADLLLLAAVIVQVGKIRGSRMQIFKRCFPIQGLFQKAEGWILAGIGGIVLVLSAWTVPYNWDSMTYRLSRVAYWAQNGSVEHFATNSIRMIGNPPLGEFIQLHVYLMQGGGDYFLTLIQGAAYLTCAAAVYGISRKISCSRGFSWLAALLFMSMPIAFGEALNTQVDLVATLWLFIFVYLLLDFIYEKQKIAWSGNNVFRVWVMGLCVAWGYLTKPSVCVAMAIFCLWLLIRCFFRRDHALILLRLALCALVGMAIPMGWEICRNIKTFGAISSPIAGERQLIGTLHPAYVLVNGLKNFVHNLPSVLLSETTSLMGTAVEKFAELLQIHSLCG